MAQACGIHFLLKVWTRVDSLASESDHCQERDAKPNLIQRPGVLVVVVLVAGAPATMPAEMMWKLSGTWRLCHASKDRRTFSEVHFAAVTETSPTDIALELLVLSIVMSVSGKKEANIPKTASWRQTSNTSKLTK